MSTAADYVGRLSDLFAFRGAFPAMSGRDQLLLQALATPKDSGLIVAGIEKLAQKVLITLLTQKGSKLYDASFGTRFLADAIRGSWRTTADVSQSFISARLDLTRQIRAEELSTDPADERLDSLTLDSVTLIGTRVTLHCTLVSLAGTSYKFLTPLTVIMH